jgi:hypothetical protein
VEELKKDVDRTLIRENLKLTVEERLVQLMRLQEFAEELRRAGRWPREPRHQFRSSKRDFLNVHGQSPAHLLESLPLGLRDP